MLKNIDRTGAPGRALPIADRIGAVIRGAGFSLRIVQRKRVQRGDAKTDEHPGTRAEKHPEVGAPRGKDHINPAWHSLSRIASGLRAVLTDLRRSSTTTEATAPLQRPSSLDPARRPRPHPSPLQAQATNGQRRACPRSGPCIGLRAAAQTGSRRKLGGRAYTRDRRRPCSVGLDQRVELPAFHRLRRGDAQRSCDLGRLQHSLHRARRSP